ncbi:glycine cleavage system protein GcvH [Bifidobacterium choloepi]|uniref:Glycine cleavage system H protein n=1 Tax=Bifidobacterium choloepi TaxID=2614131 RepID=A0A6I5N195_9BIFI|nr:glycine cleavage system protein GcvH [Bifidobacterium choloepi]NEG70377.1 glycine cleavage system protein GcvH [Bifidobacterium choloepi]
MADNSKLNLDVPRHLWYSQEHVWVDDSVEPAVLGITEYAADQLGELVFVDLPAVGSRVEAGDEMLELESAKSVEPMISPVSGTVRYVNSALEDDASIVNDDPYGEGWIVKIELDDEEPELLAAEQYEDLIK